MTARASKGYTVTCPNCGAIFEKDTRTNSNGCKPCRAGYAAAWRAGRQQINLTQERVRELLDYSPDTGVFRWRRDMTPQVRSNDQAGMVKGGYVQIKLDGKSHRAHRLAFLWVKGSAPSIIDHINGNGTDNRFANLRGATPRQNTGNRKMNSNSRTGFKGVENISRYVRGSRKWRATIKLADGRRKVLGHFATPEEAHEAYKRAAAEVFGEFARFR